MVDLGKTLACWVDERSLTTGWSLLDLPVSPGLAQLTHEDGIFKIKKQNSKISEEKQAKNKHFIEKKIRMLINTSKGDTAHESLLKY